MISEDFTKIYAPWATWILLFVSLAAGFWQFIDLRREQTVGRVLDMSREYRAGFLDAKLQFYDQWADYDAAALHTLPEAEVVKRYGALVGTFLKLPGRRKGYEKLVFFYNSLGECVKATLCDFDSANAMFGDDMLTFYDDMYPDLVSVKKYGYEANGIFDFIAQQKKNAVRIQKHVPHSSHPAS